ncbi:MAG: hypothetical protein ACREFB_19000 [Stellaceae bacterium]
MRKFNLTDHHEYEPPSLCHFGALAVPAILGGIGGAGAAAGAAGAGLIGAGSILPSLSTIGTLASIGGTALQGYSQLQQGAYAQKVAQAQNASEVAKANQDAAVAERQQETESRTTQYALSREEALAAAAGGAATDPSVLNLSGQIAQQGDYNALSLLYNGQAKSAADLYQGQIDLFGGNQAASAAPMTAIGSVMARAGSLASNSSFLRLFSQTGTTPYGAI